MARCPHCDYPIPDDREAAGARCSSCHDPLYEPPVRFSRRAREGEASCAVHAGMESVGVCARCNQHVCETCRTRWRGTIICAACADRALSTGEASPEQAGTHVQQAKASVQLTGLAWLAAGLAALVLQVSGRGSDLGVIVTFVALLVLVGAVLLAAVGMGEALAALRAGGNRTALAAAGLALGGLYIGVMLGIGTLALWQTI
jgi:hypothetical protein